MALRIEYPNIQLRNKIIAGELSRLVQSCTVLVVHVDAAYRGEQDELMLQAAAMGKVVLSNGVEGYIAVCIY